MKKLADYMNPYGYTGYGQDQQGYGYVDQAKSLAPSLAPILIGGVGGAFLGSKIGGGLSAIDRALNVAKVAPNVLYNMLKQSGGLSSDADFFDVLAAVESAARKGFMNATAVPNGKAMLRDDFLRKYKKWYSQYGNRKLSKNENMRLFAQDVQNNNLKYHTYNDLGNGKWGLTTNYEKAVNNKKIPGSWDATNGYIQPKSPGILEGAKGAAKEVYERFKPQNMTNSWSRSAQNIYKGTNELIDAWGKPSTGKMTGMVGGGLLGAMLLSYLFGGH